MAFLAAVAVVVVMVWAIPLSRAVRTIGGGLAVLIAGTVWGHPFFHHNLGPVPVTIDRVLLVVVLALALVSRKWGWVQAKPTTKSDILLVAFLAVMGLATFAHDWTVQHYQPVSRLLFWYLMPAALFWIMRISVWQEREVRGVMAMIAALAVYLSLTAMAEVMGWRAVVFPRYIMSESFPEFLGRGRGPLLNPVGNGLFITAGFFCLWFARYRAQQWGLRLACACAVFILGAGMYCTLTRSVWIGAVVGLGLVVWQTFPRRAARGLLVAATLCGSCALWITWQDLNAFKRDKHVSVAEMSQSAALRPVLATLAWRMFLDRPFLGCGLGQYKHVDQEYFHERWDNRPLALAKPYHQHNVFLALLAETGLVGCALLIGLLAAWSHEAWTIWKSDQVSLIYRQFAMVLLVFVVAYAINGLFHDVSIIPMVHSLLFTMAGALRGLPMTIPASLPTRRERQPVPVRLPSLVPRSG